MIEEDCDLRFSQLTLKYLLFFLPNLPSASCTTPVACHRFNNRFPARGKMPPHSLVIPPLFTQQVFHANDEGPRPLRVFTFNYATG